MKKLAVGLFLGLMFMFFGAFNSYADMQGCMGTMGEGMREGRMHMMEEMKQRGLGMKEAEYRIWLRLKDLGLDDNQKEAIKEIKSRTEKETIRKRADLQVARIELKDILRKDLVDMKAAEAKLKQVEGMRTDLHLSHIKALEEVKSKLTPEQRKKFMTNPDKHKRWEHSGKGMMHGHEEEKG